MFVPINDDAQPSEVDIGWRYVAERFVIALVVVVGDEVFERGLQLCNPSAGFGLQRLLS